MRQLGPVDDRVEAAERAYAAGDHVRARQLARDVLTQGHDEALHRRARAILATTEIDGFLPWIGLLGLGLTAWLVYNYWL